MNKLRQIIRLYCKGTGSKKTSAISGVSRNVVKQYISRFKASRLTLDEFELLSEEELHNLYHPPSKALVVPDQARYERLQAMLPDISRTLKRKGVTLDMVWKNYLEKDPAGYARSQFYLYLRDYRKRSGLSMHLEHKAGDKLFVDFCGDKLSIVDPNTGELREVEVFVGILGCSQLTFVEAVFSQKKEDFIECCRHNLEYLGGVPAAIVSDNLKSAVTKSSKYEPILNETFETFAEHYNTVILPARAYKPKDKAHVENAVKLVYQRIYSGLSAKAFISLEELNAAIRELLELHNNAPLKGGDSRRKLFEEEEKDTLLSLPELSYEIRKFKMCTVMKNGHVALHDDRHYYSVPYTYTGKKVKLLYTSDTVEIYYHFQRIATHQRNYRRNRYSTLADHLASQHKFLSEWCPEFFLNKAKEVSPEVAMFIEKVLETKAHPEQGYKACSGVLNLAKRVGHERITLACKRALEFGVYTYYVLEDILKKGLEKITSEDENKQLPLIPTHANLRGKDYYKQQSLNL